MNELKKKTKNSKVDASAVECEILEWKSFEVVDTYIMHVLFVALLVLHVASARLTNNPGVTFFNGYSALES